MLLLPPPPAPQISLSFFALSSFQKWELLEFRRILSHIAQRSEELNTTEALSGIPTQPSLSWPIWPRQSFNREAKLLNAMVQKKYQNISAPLESKTVLRQWKFIYKTNRKKYCISFGKIMYIFIVLAFFSSTNESFIYPHIRIKWGKSHFIRTVQAAEYHAYIKSKFSTTHRIHMHSRMQGQNNQTPVQLGAGEGVNRSIVSKRLREPFKGE